ncbi:response regulator [Thermodesulfobacteriota bacterium]
MLKILLVSIDKTSMSALKAGFEEHDVQTGWAESGGDALSMIAQRDFNLVVTDENLGDMTGLEFIKNVVSQNPMVNCAAVSTLLPEDFHEASEGLGILMQLPVRPKPEYAKELLEHLKSILDLAIETS